MQTKNNILRSDLKDNIMKRIIFRFDYQGLIDPLEFVKQIQNDLKDYFKGYLETKLNRIDLQLTNLEEISASLSVPISEIESQTIYRFNNNTFGTDNLTLDIGKYSTTLNIICDNYKNIDPYLEFITTYIKLLLIHNEFIDFKRIGLRKIGSNIYRDPEQIHKDFEKNVFNFDFVVDKYNLIKNRIEEVLGCEDPKLYINYIRSFDVGIEKDESTNELVPAFRIILDLDAYIPEHYIMEMGLDKLKTNLPGILKDINHVHLFNFFKRSVTSEFLQSNSNGKK